MKTLQLTDEEWDAVKCALQLATAQNESPFRLRSDMHAVILKMENFVMFDHLNPNEPWHTFKERHYK
jgi:hypothetical protein